MDTNNVNATYKSFARAQNQRKTVAMSIKVQHVMCRKVFKSVQGFTDHADKINVFQ